jgi:enamine deaminase RidA (YjgF/YER057c/UK114 family)
VFLNRSDYTGTNTKTGGWDRTTEEISTDLGKQTDQAFANVEIALQQAGGKGWEQVYKIRCYSAPMSDEAIGHVFRNIEKYCPNHRPIITGIGVEKLAYENMQVEIEVAAHLGP